MTADNAVLTRPGRLGDAAKPSRPLPWRVCVAVADHLSVNTTLHRVHDALGKEIGPLQVGRPIHIASPPHTAADRLDVLRADIASGRVIGVTDTVLDEVAADLNSNRRLWLVLGLVRVLTTQCAHKRRWS